jgi:transposase
MAVADRSGLPVAVHVASASPHEVRLTEETLKRKHVNKSPEKLVADKAYDSDPLDQCLKAKGIELIAPHKENRIKPATQDGRCLRRYKRRWKIERLFAWLQNYRRIVVRYEYHSQNYLAFVQLGCIVILLKQYL